ncbi:FecCD family ABC transporter permease [Mesonia aestuariivivens]|uniref:Iron ABC transporter permease n=1 Tax=Mesonia aestuariivivens TaxID=2796128 RepID=A0ABS6VYC4_9FLAO|nr:iron ABC transporter permease [Mesonia aestuariivivens]MBW2960601.1 iron ABC transporter permease [Mesonia aestuariivivens]
MQKTSLSLLLGLIILVVLLMINISLGSVSIPLKDIFASFFNTEIDKETWRYIILNYRLPKAITAVLVGSGLALSGLLMQTLFRNPLAGPYVLGLSSGASLGVAIVILGGAVFGRFFSALILSKWTLVIAASLGSILVLLAVLATSFRVKDTMALLIIGLMFASLTSAVVSMLSYFSSSESLQKYIFWSFGSLGNLSWQEVFILTVFWSLGVIISIFCIKNLNALLLGETYAKSLGTNLKQNRILVILATGLLAGSITAFAGPIAFIGLAVPHLVRQVISKSDHLVLFPAVAIGGAILMLICDSIAQLPGSNLTLPINSITSLIGAPVVIWLLLRKKKLYF